MALYSVTYISLYIDTYNICHQFLASLQILQIKNPYFRVMVLNLWSLNLQQENLGAC